MKRGRESYIYIYIYGERVCEREREIDVYKVCSYIHIVGLTPGPPSTRIAVDSRSNWSTSPKHSRVLEDKSGAH